MFGSLNEKLEGIVRSIRGKAIITNDDLDVTFREIRIALLEADVALVVVKDFIDKIKKNIVGKDVLKSIKPDQMIIKLVQDELINVLGSKIASVFSGEKSKGFHQIPLDLKNLDKGIYFISLSSADNGTSTIRLLIE